MLNLFKPHSARVNSEQHYNNIMFVLLQNFDEQMQEVIDNRCGRAIEGD